MNPVNNAENQLIHRLTNEVLALRQELNDMKTNPQPIGNGSINYAYFGQVNLGPFTVPAGFTATISTRFAAIEFPFTYDGRPAINRITLNNLYWSVKVDVNDIDHAIPYGAAIAGPEGSAITNARLDYYNSGLSESSGEMWVLYQVTNQDTVSHTYWITGTMAIPRPALKPQ